MRAGLLNKRFKIQEVTVTQNAASQITRTWATKATVWGGFVNSQDVRGRELYGQARQTHADMTHLVQLRYWEGGTITPKYRLLFGTRALNILSVANPREADIELLVTCREDVDG